MFTSRFNASAVDTPRNTDRVRRGPAAALRIGAAVFLVAGMAASGTSPASAAEATVDLGTASSFAVLAGETVTNTGPSVISGDLGVNPGSAVTGFPPGLVTNGTQHIADAVALQAQSDLTTAYKDAAGRALTKDVTGQNLGGMKLPPGVYVNTSAMRLTGTVTLNAQGDPDAVFIFKAGSTLITASGSTVALVNGASPCNVFWKVGSSATLRTGTTFVGSIMALTSASLQTGANVEGRILARNGAVTLDTNVITAPDCDTPTTPTTDTPTTPTTDTPTVPRGYPPTGMGGTAPSSGHTSTILLVLGGLAAGGAVLASAQALRATRKQ